jgi:signal peptidase I
MNKFIAEIKSLLILILIILFLKETVVEAYIVPTTSMEENILKGDFLIGSRYIYGMKVPEKIWIPFSAISIPTFLPEYRFPAFKQVARGDVVVFEYPRDPVYKYVKRCIGIAGDTVKIEDQNVYVNGEIVPLPEGGKFIMNNYLSKEVIDPDIFLGKQGNKDQYPEITIPKKGDSFTLDKDMDWKLVLPLLLYEGNKVQYIFGENSLTFTTGDKSIYKEYFPSTNATLITPWSSRFKKEHIQYLYINGKPINEIEAYTLSQDYFWMMGDNRDASEDSRFWGFVPKSHVLGQPLITWFSIDLDNYYLPRLNRIGKIPN